jgi:NADH dehydrogenase FAD-containing subunit
MADAVRSRAATDGKAHPHRIVIVGGGAGGLELATRLGDKLGRRGQAEITLIDKARAHLWKPLLHEIAAGSMDLGHHELDYLAQAHWHHFHYRTGEMIGLDRTRREVLVGPVVEENGTEVTPARGYPYDTLVLAVGSLTNDFGTPGVAEHAICLETPRRRCQCFQFTGSLFAQWKEHVEAGGLLSYGVNLTALWRQAGTIVVKVLKGAKPADLPVEQPTKFELAVNARTAKALGIAIPPSVLVRADDLFE